MVAIALCALLASTKQALGLQSVVPVWTTPTPWKGASQTSNANVSRGMQGATVESVGKCVATSSKLPARNAMMATQPPLTGALSIAPLSVALFAMVQCPKAERQSMEMGSLLVTRHVTMATQTTAMAAAAPVLRRLDGPAPTQSADRQAAAKCVATTSQLLARNAMTATLLLVTAAPTSAPWSEDLFAMHKSLKAALQRAETESLRVTRSATTATFYREMDVTRVSR